MLAGKRYMTNLKHSLRSTHVTLTHDCMSCLMTSLFCLVIEVALDLEKSFQWKNMDWNPLKKINMDWNYETYSRGDL